MIMLPIQALLGMRPVASLGLLLVDLRLPSWFPDLRLKGIRVGRARINNLKAARRTNSGEMRYRITQREGCCAFSGSDLPKRRKLESTATRGP